MKPFITIIIIIGIALIGWGIYHKYNQGTYTPNATSTSANSYNTLSQSSSNTQSSSQSKPIAMFNQGGSHICTFDNLSNGHKSTATIYIADGKMRGEFRANNSVGDIMVYNGGNLYTWKEGSATGMRSQVRLIADLPAALPKDLTGGVIIGNSANNSSWECHDWLKKSALLTPPANVAFQ